MNLKCSVLSQAGTPPEDFIRKTTEFRKAFNEFDVENWLAFHDTLFIGKQGRVFYSLRRESDLERSVFEGELTQTPLSRRLQTNPGEGAFVDFHYYDASDEPAAFFVEPVYRDGRLVGWVVLQCAINKINSKPNTPRHKRRKITLVRSPPVLGHRSCEQSATSKELSAVIDRPQMPRWKYIRYTRYPRM